MQQTHWLQTCRLLFGTTAPREKPSKRARSPSLPTCRRLLCREAMLHRGNLDVGLGTVQGEWPHSHRLQGWRQLVQARIPAILPSKALPPAWQACAHLRRRVRIYTCGHPHHQRVHRGTRAHPVGACTHMVTRTSREFSGGTID